MNEITLVDVEQIFTQINDCKENLNKMITIICNYRDNLELLNSKFTNTFIVQYLDPIIDQLIELKSAIDNFFQVTTNVNQNISTCDQLIGNSVNKS